MRLTVALLLFLLCLGIVDAQRGPNPIFSQGTVFVAPDLITSNDPTSLIEVTYIGQANRSMFDRRLKDWATYEAYLFEASYESSEPIEIQVNPEYGTVKEARKQAEKYARVIGQLPWILRSGIKTSWIHKGKELFGGGNDNVLIHTGMTPDYERRGVLEEAILHEATHTSLDAVVSSSEAWRAAQKSDGIFVSKYAAQHPQREDLAETHLVYLAIRHKPERLPEGFKERVERGIPARLKFLDTMRGSLSPFAP